MALVIKTLLCPTCSELPAAILDNMAFCGNDKCNTFSWDMTKTIDELLMDVYFIDLPPREN